MRVTSELESKVRELLKACSHGMKEKKKRKRSSSSSGRVVVASDSQLVREKVDGYFRGQPDPEQGDQAVGKTATFINRRRQLIGSGGRTTSGWLRRGRRREVDVYLGALAWT